MKSTRSLPRWAVCELPALVLVDAVFICISIVIGRLARGLAFSVPERMPSPKSKRLGTSLTVLCIVGLHSVAMSGVTITPLASLGFGRFWSSFSGSRASFRGILHCFAKPRTRRALLPGLQLLQIIFRPRLIFFDGCPVDRFL
jgi:hypothetical protein